MKEEEKFTIEFQKLDKSEKLYKFLNQAIAHYQDEQILRQFEDYIQSLKKGDIIELEIIKQANGKYFYAKHGTIQLRLSSKITHAQWFLIGDKIKFKVPNAFAPGSTTLFLDYISGLKASDNLPPIQNENKKVKNLYPFRENNNAERGMASDDFDFDMVTK